MIVIVMGVVGAGKTTVGSMLAAELGWQFADADDFHPPANVEKIRNGTALTDADRAPWLELLRKAVAGWSAANTNVVLACSALKSSYREKLKVGLEVRFAGPRRGVEALERLVLLVAAPIRTRDLRDFERLGIDYCCGGNAPTGS